MKSKTIKTKSGKRTVINNPYIFYNRHDEYSLLNLYLKTGRRRTKKPYLRNNVVFKETLPVFHKELFEMKNHSEFMKKQKNQVYDLFV